MFENGPKLSENCPKMLQNSPRAACFAVRPVVTLPDAQVSGSRSTVCLLINFVRSLRMKS